MNYEELDQLVGRVFNYFDYKSIPDEAVRRGWHKKTKYIPSECVDYIFDFITDMPSKPRNFPVEMKNAFNVWKKYNPDKMVYYYNHDGGCNIGCGGSGVLIAKKENDDGHIISYAFRCAHCNNWFGVFGTDVPIARRDKLEAAGFEIED